MNSFITGKAGTGKTFGVKVRAKESPSEYILCATTGIAAINLGTDGDSATTINSLLGYFDTNSLERAKKSGKLMRSLRRYSGREIVIDEASMLGAAQFSLLMQAVIEANERGYSIDLTLVGDFCQLPPVNDDFAFMSPEWEHINNIYRLTKVWRQEDPEFIEMLNNARLGYGDKVIETLTNRDVTFRGWVDNEFDGTTLMATNLAVDMFNLERYNKLVQSQGKKQETFPMRYWGIQRPEWVKVIPPMLTLCEDCYVMILANGKDSITGTVYANGCCGHIVELCAPEFAIIKLTSGDIVTVPRIIRQVMIQDGGTPLEKPREKLSDESSEEYESYLRGLTAKHRLWGSPWYDYLQHMWCVSEIQYLPLRLAYATTIHKAQGLTLDRVQIDYTQQFIGAPSMSYVALSRVRAMEGITIVGNPYQVAAGTNVLKKVLEWA